MYHMIRKEMLVTVLVRITVTRPQLEVLLANSLPLHKLARFEGIRPSPLHSFADTRDICSGMIQ